MTEYEQQEELFGPEGNFDDYWLGSPSTNTRLSDDEGWLSAESVLRSSRRREERQWTSHRDMIEKILGDQPNAADRAGGILDISPQFQHVRARLVARGRLLLGAERRLGGP